MSTFAGLPVSRGLRFAGLAAPGLDPGRKEEPTTADNVIQKILC